MNIGKAQAVFEQIRSDKYSETEKLQAIWTVLEMATHNGIKKDTILEAFRWLFERAVEVDDEVRMTGQKRYFWLAVTADEYELPLAVEDTAAALARRLGVSENTVRTVEYRGKNERYRRTRKGPMPGFGVRYKVRKVEVKQWRD